MSVQEMLDSLDEIYMTGDNEAIEQKLLEYINAHEQSDPGDLIGKSVLYNELGGFYRHNRIKDCGREAFENARDLLDTASELYNPDPTITMNIATTVNNLAGTYRVLNEYDLALEHFDRAIDLYGQLDNIPEDLSASALNNKGLVYLDMKEADKAEECFRQALDIVTEKGYARGASLSNLAFALIEGGKKLEAAQAFRDAADNLSDDPDSQPLCQSCLDMAGKLEADA